MVLPTDGQIMPTPGEVDPVSGNEIPAGAAPEQVRDDIDAKLSEGEYVIPAFAVNFYGPEVFEAMIINAQKATGNPPTGTPEQPETVEELPEEGLMMAEGGEVPKFNVQDFYTGIGNPTPSGVSQYSQKIYVNDQGRKLVVSFLAGQPINPIPSGFYPEGTKPVTPTPQTQEGKLEEQMQRIEEDKDSSTVDPEAGRRQAEAVWSMSGADLIKAAERAMRTGDFFESGLAKLGTGIAGAIATGLGGIGGLVVGGLARGIPDLIKNNLDIGAPKAIAIADVARQRGDMSTYDAIMAKVAAEIGVPVDQVLSDRRAGNWQKQLDVFNQNRPPNIVSANVNTPTTATPRPSTSTSRPSTPTSYAPETSFRPEPREDTGEVGGTDEEIFGGDGTDVISGESTPDTVSSNTPKEQAVQEDKYTSNTKDEEKTTTKDTLSDSDVGGYPEYDDVFGNFSKGGIVKRRVKNVGTTSKIKRRKN